MSSKTPVVGLLGGGQLGRMLCEAGAPLNAQIVILDAEKCPAKQINSNENHVTGSFKDAAKIRELASHCDVMTVEIEHIDTEVLEEIDTQGVPVRHADGTTSRKKVAVHPSWRTLRLVQNKYEQKEYLSRRGVPVAAQMAIESGDAMRESMEAASAKFGYPWMLKARTDSYDGRGNFKVSSWADLEHAHREFGHLSCYAEKWVPFELELAVMVVRTEDDAGQLKRVVPYPVVETVHEDNICSKVFMPPRGVSAEVCEKAQKVAMSVVGHLWGRGVFAVEMFLTREGDITFNECAPRPHNSGHASIESIPYMSQFKAQLAAILDEPLPEVLEPHVSSSIMINILGGASPDSHLALVEKAKSMYGNKTAVYVHLYGKDSKPSRKIGHITVTGFGSIAELETFAKPLLQMTDSIRQERLQSSSASLRPQAAVPAASPAAAATTKTKRPQGTPLVLVTMGSDSDLPVLKAGIDILNQFGVPWEVDITSAHRTPDKMAQRAREAADRGLKVIIAAAGGAAHLPGMLAAYTPLPVIGVPVKATHLDGYDSLLSIVQMPRGVPTATVAINNSTNAALLAIRFLGAFMPELLQKMKDYQLDMEQQVKEKAETLREIDVDAYLEKMGKNSLEKSGCPTIRVVTRRARDNSLNRRKMQLDHGHRRPSRRLPVNPRRHKVPPEHRKRVAAACNSCNVRRIKCSGEHPCSQCATTARDCVYPTIVEKVYVPRTELDDLRKRVEVYEKALQDAVSDPMRRQELLHHAASPESSKSASLFGNTSQLDIATDHTRHGQPSGSIPAKIEPTDDDGIQSPGRLLQDAEGMGRYMGESAGLTFLDHLKELMGAALPTSPHYSPAAAAVDESRFLSSLGNYPVDDQPSPSHAVNPLWLPPENTIRIILSELRHFIQDGGGHWASGGIYWWGDLETVPVHAPVSPLPDVDLGAYRHLAFYHAALAVGCQSTTTQPPPRSGSGPSLSEPYYARAAMLLGNPLEIKRRTIGDVASLALMSFYLVETNRLDAAYMYVTAAMHISIMLGAHHGWVDERGKRVFWSVYCLDRWLSCLTGRPPTMTDEAIRLPLPADDPMMPSAVGLRAHVELSRLSGQVVSNTYHGSKTEAGSRQPEKAIRMLEQWQSALPPAVRLTDGLSNDPAACHLHMRYNQLLILAIRPLLLSAVKRAVAGLFVAQNSPMEVKPQNEPLKLCIAAAVRNMALARHVSTLNGDRKTLHAGLHFIFHAAVCLILRPLVFKHENLPDDAISAMNDVDYGISKMLEASAKGNTDGRACADTLGELRRLVERLLAPSEQCPLLEVPPSLSSAASMVPHLVGTQEGPLPPRPIGNDPVLYDEFVTWMGDDWPIYNNFVSR
ncbi:hypothetical protein E4U49_000722 [Claviceps purpurea]|nr:hypothetical protein E4U49_000722 [Claviceps purpurea]